MMEIFALTASSEKQFLNLVEIKLEKAILGNGKLLNDGLETLRYFNTLLYRHTRRIQGAMAAIRGTNHAKWPKADDEVVRRARKEVEQDHHDIHEHANSLYKRCQKEIAVLMNSMAILESEKAINQAGRIEKLTLLAFIFVPISFAPSFYSMNARELQDVPLWPWFLFSAMMLFLSSLFLFVDFVRYAMQEVRDWWASL
ncbi:hypothetical protein QQX98_007271 [Neonectria punicea]|uniref:Uncharacterized protein n=1 Tax=Neonectria punicea TaxID=979145 RepID=A0ABR1GYZ3_9HYPO